MEGRSGLSVLEEIRRSGNDIPVLMLSTYPDRQYAVRSLKLGASGYLNKSADSEQMIEAIQQVSVKISRTRDRDALFATIYLIQ